MMRIALIIGLATTVVSVSLWAATARSSWAVTLYQRDGHCVMVHAWKGVVQAVHLRSEHKSLFQYAIEPKARRGAGRPKVHAEHVYTTCRSCGSGVTVVGLTSHRSDLYGLSPTRGYSHQRQQVRHTGCPVTVSSVALPLWFLTFLGVAAVGLAFTPTLFRRRTARLGECTACGYSLEGNQSGTCPECGAAVAPAQQEKRPVPHK